MRKKKKRLKEGDFVYVFVSDTHTPQKKKKKFSSRPQETKKTQQIYIPVFRVALLLIFFGRLGEKKDGDRDRKKKKQHSFPIRKEY